MKPQEDMSKKKVKLGIIVPIGSAARRRRTDRLDGTWKFVGKSSGTGMLIPIGGIWIVAAIVLSTSIGKHEI